jgi:DNA-binding transcriptional regulator YiaG
MRAKRAIDELADTGRCYVEVPVVEDLAAFQTVMTLLDVGTVHLDPAATVDPRGIRETLGLTQEQFALRFGLELDTLRNWETGRREPDTAAKSYLRVIAKEPARVQLALAGG